MSNSVPCDLFIAQIYYICLFRDGLFLFFCNDIKWANYGVVHATATYASGLFSINTGPSKNQIPFPPPQPNYL